MNLIEQIEPTLSGIYFSFLFLGLSVPVAKIVIEIIKDQT